MRKRILRWLFGHDLDEYIDVLKHWSKSIDGWGDAINITKDWFVKNGSELLIYIDNGYDRLVIKNGKCVQVH